MKQTVGGTLVQGLVCKCYP